jgi:DUF4097 and DUF4098 domain-containing protein YvlB
MGIKLLRPTLTLAMVALLCGGCKIHITDTPLFTSTKAATVDHVEKSAVDVETHNGAIRIARSGREDVEIVATVRAESQERADATTVNAQRDETGRLIVRVAWPGGDRRGREACDLDISIPDAFGVRIKTHNGEISILGLAGAAELETHNGDVRVQGHDGDVRIGTYNGQIVALRVTGPISAETHNGSIDVDEAATRVEAHTHNGGIDVMFGADSSGPVIAESHNGAVTIEFGSGFGGQLTASTSNGSIELEGIAADSITERRKTRVALRLGEAEAVSTVSTRNGAVTLRRISP